MTTAGMRWRVCIAVFSVLGLGVTACGGARPNVIVVVVDTLRADRLGLYGNPRGLTPFLDSLGTNLNGLRLRM